MEGFKASLQAWLADPAGRYEALAMDFDWQRTPFTTWHTPAAICAVYLVVVALLTPRAQAMSKEFKELRKQGKARPVTLMTHVFAMHNLGVCLLSAAMFGGGAWEVYRRVTGAVTYGSSVQYGGGDQLHWQFLFCEDTSMQSKGPVFLWSYIYALSKIPELLDTVYALIRGTCVPTAMLQVTWPADAPPLALRSIPPSYTLHVFHHAVVLFMVYFWMDQQQSLQFIGLLFNTAVHVVMYCYYTMRAYGITPWWKNYITRMQIVQFMTSFASLCVGLWLRFTPAGPSACAGEGAVLFNAAFNLILLSGFVGVLFRNTKIKTA